MRRVLWWRVPALALVLSLLVPPSWAQPVARPSRKDDSLLRVDCEHGGRLSAALRQLRERRGPVIIEVRGLCEEAVLIDRPQVTLRGESSERDGIVNDGSAPNAVMIRSTFEVTLENLAIRSPLPGATFALGVNDSFRIRVVSCVLEGDLGGAVLSGSNGSITDSVLRGDIALSVGAGTGAGCFHCTLESPPGGRQAVIVSNARLTLSDSSARGRNAVSVGDHGTVVVRGGALRSEPDAAGLGLSLSASEGSEITVSDGTLEGPILARGKSVIDLTRVTQALPAAAAQPNRWALDSVLRATGPTTLAGDIFLDHLSQAILRDGTQLLGRLVCDPSTDAWCFGPVELTESSCGSCPAP